jgi:hypothetical protein
MKRLLLPLIFIACNSYAASIQKWVDKNGNVHYGDTPPASIKTELVNVTRPPSNPGKPLPRLSDSKISGYSSNKNSSTARPKSRSTAEIDREVCEKARKNLQIIASSSLIRLRQSDGTERILNDQEIDERRQRFEADIKQYCH